MKIVKALLLILLIHPCFSQKKTGFSQDKIAFKQSKWYKINTLSYFDSPKTPSVAPFVPKTIPTNNQVTIYFDKNDKKTTQDKAYYFRKVQFDSQNNPIGNVEDRFKANNNLKFTGTYFRYNADEELTNTSFQGDCIFFSEDGTRSVRTYKDGELQKEITFLANSKVKSEQIFNANQTRRYFKEITYGADGAETENIVGKYNTTLKTETYTKTLLNSTGKKAMVIEYENKCPKPVALFFDENGKEVPATLQDFSCSVNTKDWSWQGNQVYLASYLETERKYQILSNNAGMGALTIPIEGDFKKKVFEISAEFETSKQQENMPEFGIVWQYINDDNYSYFVLNATSKTFEINMKVKGELKKFMTGIKPQLNLPTDTNKYLLKIVANPTQNKYEYFVNGQKIESYNKFPAIPDVDLKKMNSGFVFKPAKGGESILLNKFECKLF